MMVVLNSGKHGFHDFSCKKTDFHPFSGFFPLDHSGWPNPRMFLGHDKVLEELRREFERYERALCSNDVKEQCQHIAMVRAFEMGIDSN